MRRFGIGTQVRQEFRERIGNQDGVFREVGFRTDVVAPHVAHIVVNPAAVLVQADVVAAPIKGVGD